MYGAVLHVREPITAAETAEWADCSEQSARAHLSFYADLGIVIPHEGRPVRYERNDDYFEWRRVNKLVRENTVNELRTQVSELTDRIEEYRNEHGIDSPAEVDVLEFDAEQVDDVYVELGDWATIVEERRLHERARKKPPTRRPRRTIEWPDDHCDVICLVLDRIKKRLENLWKQ